MADGVLAYLSQAPQAVTRIAERFRGALIAFDTYTKRALDMQHRRAAKTNLQARWAWPCDDPRSLTSLGLDVVAVAATTRPPGALTPPPLSPSPSSHPLPLSTGQIFLHRRRVAFRNPYRVAIESIEHLI